MLGQNAHRRIRLQPIPPAAWRNVLAILMSLLALWVWISLLVSAIRGEADRWDGWIMLFCAFVNTTAAWFMLSLAKRRCTCNAPLFLHMPLLNMVGTLLIPFHAYYGAHVLGWI